MKKTALLAYTLIEILVATVVIGILFTVGYPSVRDYSRKQKLIAAANLVRSDLRSAREKALAGEKPSECKTPVDKPLDSYSFEWCTASTYRIVANCSGVAVPACSDTTSPLILKSQGLPTGISVASPANIKFKTLAQGAVIDTSIQLQDLYSNKVDIPISVSGGIGELAYIAGGASPTPTPSPTPCPTCLPLGWLTGDIGGQTPSGTGTFSSGVFTLGSSRSTIGGTSDEFRFVYRNQTLSADGEIFARVLSLTNVSGNLAGVMMRKTLDPGSEFASTLIKSGSSAKAIYRTSLNASSGNASGNTPTLPFWVKVKKVGTSYSMWQSSDSATGSPTGWTQVGSSITISPMTSVYMGLVVSSAADLALATSTFGSVSVPGAATPTPTPTAPGATATPTATPTSTPALDINLALNKPASASNTSNMGRANDGDITSYWVHSTTSSKPYWQVDLGSAYSLSKIEFYARSGSSSTSRRNFEIRGSNDSTFDSTFAASTTLYTQGSTPFNAGSKLTVTVTNTNTYRYYRVKKTQNEELEITEFRAFD